MTNKKLLKTCELFYSSHHIPLACFAKDRKLLKSYCSYGEYTEIFKHIADKIQPSGINPELISDTACLYGAIKIRQSNQILFIGPFVNKNITDEVLDRIIYENKMNWNEKEYLEQFFYMLPKQTYNQFLNLIVFMHYVLNNEEISSPEHFGITSSVIRDQIGSTYAENILKETEILHGTYNFEQQMLSYVRNGDVDGLNAFFFNTMKNMEFKEGKLADNELRQQKNLFIGLICIVGKFGAIKGNLDIEQTYQLIDLYVQECERCQSIDEISTLRYNAIIDFTRRVAELKHPNSFSQEVYAALQFIKTHTNQPIGIMDVVEHIGKSRTVFLEKFKRETGQTIAKCILQAKLQEAKLLLAYSDRSLAEISNFFYFSSQSYFQNTFKKQFGITPLKYRQKKQNHV